MRCEACNKNLSDFEATRKDLHGNFLELCNKCYSYIKEYIPSIERHDLSDTEDISDEPIGETFEFSEWSDD